MKIIKVLHEETSTLKDKTVLDLGCSTGVTTKELSNVSMLAVGVDLDREALLVAKIGKKVELVLSNGLNLPFKWKAFDVVCCNQVMEYVQNKEMLAEEIYRILKPGGVCYLGAVNKIAAICTGLIRKVSDFYFKTHTPFKGESYYGRPSTYWRLRKTFHVFNIKDRTPDVLKNANAYFVDEVPKYLKTIFRYLPTQIIKILIPFSWSWIFILRRPGTGG